MNKEAVHGVTFLFWICCFSICCMAGILYVSHRYIVASEAKMEEVLLVRNDIDLQLRQIISNLQKEIITLPKVFAVSTTQSALQEVQNKYQVLERRRLEGRDAYASLFTRSEKRDLAAGKVLAQHVDGGLFISSGEMDSRGAFGGAVQRLRLASTNPDKDLAEINNLIAAISSAAPTKDDLEEKIASLKRITLDNANEAERVRLELIAHGSRMHHVEKSLFRDQQASRKTYLPAGIFLVCCNILLLLLVSQPLLRAARRHPSGLGMKNVLSGDAGA